MRFAIHFGSSRFILDHREPFWIIANIHRTFPNQSWIIAIQFWILANVSGRLANVSVRLTNVEMTLSNRFRTVANRQVTRNWIVWTSARIRETVSMQFAMIRDVFSMFARIQNWFARMQNRFGRIEETLGRICERFGRIRNWFGRIPEIQAMRSQRAVHSAQKTLGQVTRLERPLPPGEGWGEGRLLP